MTNGVNKRQTNTNINTVCVSSTHLVFPANMRCWPNVGLLLGKRRIRWANSKPTLDQRPIFAGLAFDALGLCTYIYNIDQWELDASSLFCIYYEFAIVLDLTMFKGTGPG